MKIIKKIPLLLNKLNHREKFLLLLMLSVFCMVLLSMCVKQTKSIVQNMQITSKKIKQFKFWISNEESINEKLASILKVVDGSKTYTGPQLTGKIEDFSRQSNLTYSISSPETREEDIFMVHKLKLRCENAKLKDLIDFGGNIYKMKPYISIGKVKMRANNFNPELLEADFDISSLQLKEL